MGKSSEIPTIKQFMPKHYERLVEPFLGGGAVYFNMESPKSVVNDFNKELISFYSLLNTESYKIFVDIMKTAALEREQVNKMSLQNLTAAEMIGAAKGFCAIPEYQSFLTREVHSKAKTAVKIRLKREKENLSILTDDEMLVHYRTGINAALFYTYRALYNQSNQKKTYDVQHIAYWFLMRELAYSGMFRFSRSGNFNVPYGGISYNSKNLLTKLDYLEKIRNADFFKKTEFNNLDFQALFEQYDYFREGDFIFLDPPYDSEFSQYNIEEDFTRKDQERLRDVLLKTKANIMVVIKDTDFIKQLYAKDFKIHNFDKSYSVNFRNRNEQAVNHLLITNYEIIKE